MPNWFDSVTSRQRPNRRGPLLARADAVAPVVAVGEAAARPADDDRAELAGRARSVSRRMPSMFGIFESGPTQIPS